MKSVSIIIPTWNGHDLLAEYLPSVIAAAERYGAESRARVEILIVDDGSTDGSLDWLGRRFNGHKFVSVVQLPENLGFLRAVNRGFEQAKNEIVFLLNNDVQVEPDCVGPLVRHFNDPHTFAVCSRAGRIGSSRLDGGGKIGRFERGFWRVFLNYEALPNETAGELISFYGSGGYTAYDRTKWEQLGGFEACLSPNYWEDVEICYRAWKRGWKVLYEPNSRVAHKGSATMSKHILREETRLATERNRFLMTWINLHDHRMFASHLLWLFLSLAGSAISLKWTYLQSFALALRQLGTVRAKRSIELHASLISDRELARKFEEIADDQGIRLVETEAAEIEFAEMIEKNARRTAAGAVRPG